MTQERMAVLFNEWQRQYIANPEKFSREFSDVIEFLAEIANGEEPSYGAACTALMAHLDSEVA